MSDLEETLAVIGFPFCGFIVVLCGIGAYDLELVAASTFEKGLVKIDDEISYTCKPTKKTIEFKKLNEKIKKLSEAKK